MLTNQYGEKLSKRLKESFFTTQMSLLSGEIQLPYIVIVLLMLISFWINISIFFLSNPLSPQVLNEGFQLTLFTQISQRIGISMTIVKILIPIVLLSQTILFIIHLRSNFMNNILTKILSFLIAWNILFLVPEAHLLVICVKEIFSHKIQPEELVVNLVYILFTTISIVTVGAFIMFRIRAFRKKSIYWGLDNMNEFADYLLKIARVIVIMIDGRTVSFTIISFVLELFMRKGVKTYLTKEIQLVQYFYSNLNLSVHIGLLVGDFTSSRDLATEILAFFILISLISSFLSIYALLNEERYFPLCNSPLHHYYDFYFHFIEKKIKGSNKVKMSVKKDSESDKVLSIHTLNCQDKNCKIKNVKFSQQTYCEDLENLCNQIMVARATQTVQNQILYELWKFETGNKYKFRMQNKQLSVLHEFIIFSALNLSRLNQKSDSVNQQNIKSLKNIFYDKLQNCLECFSLFYQQVTKTQPKLDTILCVGNDIKQRTNDLKTMYSELLKHSVINFKTAQVYVQFQNYFLKQNNVNQQSIDRLRKIQKSKQADHIQQIYLPTLTSYSQTGLIQNMNTECLSLFRLTRFQMKSKSLGSLIYPQIKSLTVIKQKLKQNKNQKLFTFFKRRDQIGYGSIVIKERYIENKKFDVVTIEKNTYSDYKNVILVRKDSFGIQAVEKEETFIRPNLNYSSHLTLRWRYLYTTYLMEKIEELSYEKIVKVRVQELENSLFVMNIEDGFHEDFYIVNIKVIKDMEKRKNRASSFMLNKAQPSQPKTGRFHFFYDFQDVQNSLCLYGVNSQYYRYNSTLKKTKSLGKMQKDLSNMLIVNTLLQENRYSRGIKSYRLHGGQLYNIDLEDKQGYVEMFEDKAKNHNEHSKQEENEADLYIITGIYFILLVLIGLSIGYNSLANAVHSDVVGFYSNCFRIEQLRLQMNRITSITRDIEDNRYANLPGLSWRSGLLTAYNKLKDLRYESLLFQSNQIMVPYRNITYTGTLNQIIDVMISHVYQMTVGDINLQEIVYFHDTYIAIVNPKIIEEKQSLVQQLNQAANDFNRVKEILLGVGIACLVCFYLLLAALIVVLNNRAKKKLKSLMLMSDSEARMNQTMADKLKYAVDMIKKNFDFDLKAIVGPAESHRQRKKSKEVIIGIQKKLFILLALVCGFILHFVLYYKFTSEITSVLSSIQLFQKQGESLIQTYSIFTELTNSIDHFNKYDNDLILSLRQKVNFLSLNRQNLNFNPQTNNFIDLIFYQNSCTQLSNNEIFSGEPVKCHNSLPNYIIRNPFQLGMIAFFSREHYNILDNITQTFGCTGLYSSTFVKTFSLIADKIRNYGLDYIQTSFDDLTLYNIIYTVITVMYVAITLCVIYVLKGMNKQVNELLKFLNYHKKQQVKKKTKDEQFKNNKKDLSSQSLNEDKVSENQQSNASSADLSKKDDV